MIDVMPIKKVIDVKEHMPIGERESKVNYVSQFSKGLMPDLCYSLQMWRNRLQEVRKWVIIIIHIPRSMADIGESYYIQDMKWQIEDVLNVILRMFLITIFFGKLL